MQSWLEKWLQVEMASACRAENSLNLSSNFLMGGLTPMKAHGMWGYLVLNAKWAQGRGWMCLTVWSKVLLPPFVSSSWVESSPRLSETTALYSPSSALVTYQTRVCVVILIKITQTSPKTNNTPPKDISHITETEQDLEKGEKLRFSSSLPMNLVELSRNEVEKRPQNLLWKDRGGLVQKLLVWRINSSAFALSLCVKPENPFGSFQPVRMLNFQQPPTVKNILFVIRVLASQPGVGWKGPQGLFSSSPLPWIPLEFGSRIWLPC